MNRVIMCVLASAAGLFLTMSLLRTPASNADTGSNPVYLRVNQIGYQPEDKKVALAMTNAVLAGQTFKLVPATGGGTTYSAKAGSDRGRYGNFGHLYELDFSTVTKSGRYKLRLGGATSPVFSISSGVFSEAIASSLKFFQVQRCGNTNPSMHGVCHLKDGKAKDGPAAGSSVDASGGWHDAGDYLKFLINTGLTVNVMLAAYQRNPAAFPDGDGNGTPDVLDEAKVGLDWILKLWDPARKVLYYQVGDESDHDAWRMPEEDASLPPRPVWSCKPGRGANVAGKAAAALALGSVLWGDSRARYADEAVAVMYLDAAKQIYAWGKTRPGAQSSTSHFYDETSWKDDMALAAAELCRATGTRSYLTQARTYAIAAGNVYGFGYSEMQALAHYEIARLDPAYSSRATAYLADDLEAMKDWADSNPFRAGVEAFWWGSATDMAGTALEALWYEDLSGDARYRTLAIEQRDFVLGANPWGVCWINSSGTTWPRTPHHQVADLTHSQLVGFWDEGPINRSDWNDLDITLRHADEYAMFQASEAVYHDDVEDYGTNEPTINANAEGLAMLALQGL